MKLPRRYSRPALTHLGITLPPLAQSSRRDTVIHTGRIDNTDVHPGLPPEPMVISMKWLAREAREQTSWARRHLVGHTVTWQFDTAEGLKYAANFDAAEALDGQTPDVVQVGMAPEPKHEPPCCGGCSRRRRGAARGRVAGVSRCPDQRPAGSDRTGRFRVTKRSVPPGVKGGTPVVRRTGATPDNVLAASA